MSDAYLAFDLGAESGRAILGRLSRGTLAIEEVRRFPNGPIRQNGSLYWDILRLWSEMRQALEGAAAVPLASVGVDGWGVDYALIGERGNLLENPYHYRDALATDYVTDAVLKSAKSGRWESVAVAQQAGAV